MIAVALLNDIITCRNNQLFQFYFSGEMFDCVSSKGQQFKDADDVIRSDLDVKNGARRLQHDASLRQSKRCCLPNGSFGFQRMNFIY